MTNATRAKLATLATVATGTNASSPKASLFTTKFITCNADHHVESYEIKIQTEGNVVFGCHNIYKIINETRLNKSLRLNKTGSDDKNSAIRVNSNLLRYKKSKAFKSNEKNKLNKSFNLH